MYTIDLKENVPAQVKKIFGKMIFIEKDEYDIVVEAKEIESFLVNALKYEKYNAYVPAYRLYTYETEEYIDHDIAGIYAGSYKEKNTYTEDTWLMLHAWKEGDVIYIDYEEDY